MAAQVFGGGEDRDIRAQRQRLAQQSRGPGVIHSQPAIVAPRQLGQLPQVRHLVGQRAGRLGIDHARVGTQQLRQAGAVRPIEGEFDAQPRQVLGAEAAHRLIDRVGHQHMIAGAQLGQQHDGDRGLARRIELGAMALLQLDQRVFQRVRAVGAARAV